MKEKNKGVFLILCSSLFFAIMAAAVKSVPQIPLAEKMFFRNFIGLLAVGIPMAYKKRSFRPQKPKLVLLRSIFGLGGVAFYYTSLKLLNLADAVIINKLSPFFVVLLSVLFLGESLSKKKIIAIGLALLGATLVIKPGFNFSLVPALIGLIGAFLAGSAYTTIRKLSAYDAPRTIVFYFCLLSTLTTLPFMFLGQFVMPNPSQFFWLCMIGLSALGGQMFMTTAYSYAPASELSIYTYASVVFSTIISVIIWQDWPSLSSGFGAVLIVSGALINFSKNKKRISKIT